MRNQSEFLLAAISGIDIHIQKFNGKHKGDRTLTAWSIVIKLFNEFNHTL